MVFRIAVGLKPELEDFKGKKLIKAIKRAFDIDVEDIRIVTIYTTSGLTKGQVEDVIQSFVLHDPVTQIVSYNCLELEIDWIVEVGFRPGVTDNEGRAAREAISTALGISRENFSVYTSFDYVFKGKNLDENKIKKITEGLLANLLIQQYRIKDRNRWIQDPGFSPILPKVTGKSTDKVEEIPILSMSEEEMLNMSRERVLALNKEELLKIKEYYSTPEVQAHRKKMGLPVNPTDVEIESLAQTWSEHCKHKIFNAKIKYHNKERNKTYEIDSLFNTFISKSTDILRKKKGNKDFCLSVFKDNAGIISFDKDHNVCIKVETHNSPSALDPYGGALTGIVGVNRDPMGSGLGANLICNMDVFCFASPFYNKPLPPRLLHPMRILEGVRQGVEDGGNQSGIPTVNGAIVFDDRYLGKPLVFCGTVGMMPSEIKGRPTHTKKAMPKDKVIMVGGRVGKDGIHGATFSSEELHEGSPATAVQIGDAYTQRKMYDFLMKARDLSLYNAITDNGAGGLSSSVGEMAQDTGGCEIDLSLVPLKYDGLVPWEILLSEAQERMTVAVPPEHLEEFLNLAKEMDVEATVLGEFNQSGYFTVKYKDKVVADLNMDFLHKGVPQMQLTAVWERPKVSQINIPDWVKENRAAFLRKMIGRLNICSKEYVIRQYDHEVQGGSVIKPLMGLKMDGPTDAAVLRPVLDRTRGLVVGNGICPKYSDLDTYWMAALAIDEAIRNCIAVGGDLKYMCGVDNFCWCDPIQSEKTPDGPYKLAQLVRANQALSHFCLGFGVPCISGKDSMKNDYFFKDIKISIPPTLLFTVLGVIPDITFTITSDLKKPGDLIYILGITKDELGGSEFASEIDQKGGNIPQVDLLSARKRYLHLHKAIVQGIINSCHDLSDGGFAISLSEMAIGGDLGAYVDLSLMPCCPEGLDIDKRLYSETPSRFLVTTSKDKQDQFEKLFKGQPFSLIGEVISSQEIIITYKKHTVLKDEIKNLKKAWKDTLAW